MKIRYSSNPYRKILLPVIHDCGYQEALVAARAIAGQEQLLLGGIVPIPQGESLSTAAAPARQVRQEMQKIANGERTRRLERVRASYNPWEELVQMVKEEEPDLLVMQWPCQVNALCANLTNILAHPPCDIAIVRGPIPAYPKRVVIPLRGGPYAELALRLSLTIARNCQSDLTSLHLKPRDVTRAQEPAFRGIARVLANLPEVHRLEMHTDDPVQTILDTSRDFDLVVMGASAQPASRDISIGPVTERILNESPAGVIAVKTRRPVPQDMNSEAVGQTAISVLVDKWFAENTYHAEEFEDLSYLLSLKRKQNCTISLALPALNEEETVGNVIQTFKVPLMDEVPLLDEIVLIDSNSSDRTRQIASDLDVPVYIHQHIFPHLGERRGKGEALWKSLYVTHGDILIWVDTDIVNIHPRFVYGLVGPLLLRPDLQFIKGFYRRPLKVGDKIQAGGGGRVTELTARPLLNLFYPELSGVIQPLSGEYGGRRAALQQLPFFSGYGVEIGLIIDFLEKFGLGSIAQVDLQERIHHNQPLDALSKMSFAILQAVMRKMERRYNRSVVEEVNKTMKLIRYEPGRFFLDIEEIAERERPPMIEIPEYLESHPQ